ncbi:hypothetical protein AB0I95_15080 [Micromonospora sp. NPDC049751]|uniref:hypothetical protein n=1 Tax=Micromonospora sp. NPDC049751 TaxID=3154837 RepID=UPI0033CD5A28
MTRLGDEVVVRGERYLVFDVEHSERSPEYRSFYLRRLGDESDWLAVGRRVQHNTRVAPAPRHLVEIVTYGDEIHVYNVGDESAKVTYTVAIGANLTAFRLKLSPWTWREIRNAESFADVEIHDHR